MTDAEMRLIEASLVWRRVHGPAMKMTSSAMTEVADAAEDVIRERNIKFREAQDDHNDRVTSRMP